MFSQKQIGEKAQEKKLMYVGFIALEVYNRVNRECIDMGVVQSNKGGR